MAFTDWDIDLGQAGGSFIGGDDATQQTNALLSNPLVLQGGDCRRYEIADFAQNRRDIRYSIDNGAYPEFTSIPDTKAISVRAWVRKEPQFGGEYNCVFIFAKGSTINANSRANGYVLTYGRTHDGGLLEFQGTYNGLSLVRRGTADNGSFLVNANITTLAADTWHQIRLDVIPTLNGAVVDSDTVRVYTNTGTEGTPIWTLQYEDTFLLTAPYAHPWGVATTRVGFGASVLGNAIGANKRACFIDGFDARLKLR